MIPFEEEILTPTQQLNEYIMTSLRTQWGFPITNYKLRITNLIQKNLEQVDTLHYTLENGVLKLTDEGKLFADSIAAQLFMDEEQIL